MKPHAFARVLLACICLIALGLNPRVQSPALAATDAGVVGSGTPGSCTEAALNAALAGGGAITFNCGAGLVTITFTAVKTISSNTAIDGGGRITFDGQGVTRHFIVNANARLTLNNLALVGGKASGDGGSIFNNLNGTLVVNNSRFANNQTTVSFSGGAIVSYGPLTVTNSLFENNIGGGAGAIYPRWAGGKTWIVSSVLRNNQATSPSAGWGGAILIWDGASLELSDSEIYGNSALQGGAVYVTTNSAFKMYSSVIRNNTAAQDAGAIYNSVAQSSISDSAILTNTSSNAGAVVNNGGTLSIVNTRLAGNTATGASRGGALYNTTQFINPTLHVGALSVLSSTLAGNTAESGGGIYNEANVTINNSTLSGNSATLRGGGLLVDDGTTNINQSTFSGNNSATHGGAIYKVGGTLNATFSTIAGNMSVAEGTNLYFDLNQGDTAAFEASVLAYGTCAGDAVTSAGYNLDSGATCGLSQPSDKSNTDPVLLPLADNGGTDWTHLPDAGSAAIDAYSGGNCPATDQRGFARPAGAACDIGAVEVGGANAATTINERVNVADDFTAVNGRLLWLKGADCGVGGDPEQRISRIAINGGVEARDVYSEGNACGNSSLVPRSNIVADADFIYWTTDQGVMRQSARADSATDPEVWFNGLTGFAELGITPEFLIVIKNGNLTLIDKQTKATTQFNDGAARRPGGTKTATGRFVYWISAGQLKRYNAGSGQTDVINANAVAYAAVGARQHCYAGSAAQCENGDFVFFSTGNSVIAFDNLTGKSEVVHTSNNLIYDVAFDRDTLVTSEEQPQAGNLLTNAIVAKASIGKINSNAVLAKSLFTSPIAASRAIDKLKVSDGFALWRAGDRVDQICLACLLLKPNLTVTDIEVTQGVQAPGNTVVLVQGRDTWVRVHVKVNNVFLDKPMEGVTARLKVYGQTFLGTLTPIAPRSSIASVGVGVSLFDKFTNTGRTLTVQPNPDRANIDHSFLFQLPRAWTSSSGTSPFALIAEINPDRTIDESNFDDNRMMKPATFYRSGRLQVQFVSWGYSLPGSSTQIFPDPVKDIDATYSYIRRTYPVASSLGSDTNGTPGFRPGLWTVFDDQMGQYVNQSNAVCKDRILIIFNIPIPLKGDGNLCAAKYSNRRLEELRVQRGLDSSIFIYGMISDNAGKNWVRGIATGMTSSGPTGNPASFTGTNWDTDTTYGDWYAAHEIAHTLGRDHPFTGSLSDTLRIAGGCLPNDTGRWGVVDGGLDSGYNHPDGQLGNSDALLGFDPGFRSGFTLGNSYKLYPGTKWYDFMSYCKNQWISDITTWAIYTRLRPSLMMANAAQDAEQAQMPKTPATPLVGDWLLVQGDITENPDAAFVATAKKLNQVGMIPPLVPGPYAIQLLDAGNVVLAEYAFTPDEADDASGKRAFTQAVNNVQGARAVRIVKKPANTVIGGKLLSDNPPAVSNVQLSGMQANAVNAPLVGDAMLTWSASDPDDDALSFDVFYSLDGGATLLPLRLGVSGNSTTVDTSIMSGGTVIFRVIATDGTFVTQADSAAVNVALKPPAVQINTPDNLVANFGQLLVLSGQANDAQDGALSGNSLVWSDANGVLGVGDALPIDNLAIGKHVIQLIATNSKGQSSSASINVFIDDNLSLPGPTLSLAPAQLAFAFGSNGSAAQSEAINVSNIGSGDLNWTASANAGWLSVSPASGATPGSFTVTANPAGIANDTALNGVVTVQAMVDGVPQKIEVPVTIMVGAKSRLNEPAPGMSKQYLPAVLR